MSVQASPSEKLEAVVVGTGFGGAVSACRLSSVFGPGKVWVFERGKRYPMGSFPRSPHALGLNFWNLCEERRRRPRRMAKSEQHGMFDVRNFRRMDAVVAAGFGGGSLIYANVFLEPPDHVFDERWPRGVKKPDLAPYYRVAKEVLGSRPMPSATNDDRRRVLHSELFEYVARKIGRTSELVDLNVFFGNDFQNPLEIGLQDRNRHGAVQTSCTYCGECDVGCNTHSKNTLDLNYLFRAEHAHGARILTEHVVREILPVDERHEVDPSADGSHGYRVRYWDVRDGRRSAHEVLTARVVLAAGTLGTTELLLQGRKHGTLKAVSNRLGLGFSGNGDFLSFVLDGQRNGDPNYGPVITQRTDFNLFEHFDPERAFVLEDASYPSFAAWFVEGAQPRYFWIKPVWNAVRSAIAQVLRRGRTTGYVGEVMGGIIGGADRSYRSSVLLCMGLDRSNGTMSLGQDGYIEVDWPRRDSQPLYDAILEAGREFARVTDGSFVPLASWFWPFRRNVTVHGLGGCALGLDAQHGVTSPEPATFGQVHGYKGLYVADGALAPSAVGANPTATITALAERVAEGITRVPPTGRL